VYNLFNHMFLASRPIVADLNLANNGSFGNNFFNSSGGRNPTVWWLYERTLNGLAASLDLGANHF